MKRILLTAIASLSLLATLPALSAASSDRSGDHGGRVEHHHRGERQRGDRRREDRRHVRREHFHGTASGTTSPGTTNPTSTPSPAGTVKSFENGVLTIALADGSAVSGLVTGETRIRCEGMDHERDFASHDGGSNSGSGDRGDNDNGDNGDNGNDSQCAAMLQQPGTTVVNAELNIVQGTASWGEVELRLS